MSNHVMIIYMFTFSVDSFSMYYSHWAQKIHLLKMHNFGLGKLRFVYTIEEFLVLSSQFSGLTTHIRHRDKL